PGAKVRGARNGPTLATLIVVKSVLVDCRPPSTPRYGPLQAGGLFAIGAARRSAASANPVARKQANAAAPIDNLLISPPARTTTKPTAEPVVAGNCRQQPSVACRIPAQISHVVRAASWTDRQIQADSRAMEKPGGNARKESAQHERSARLAPRPRS